MTKGIRQVRKSIKKRVKQRGQAQPMDERNIPYTFIQEEEKHGFEPPLYSDFRPSKQAKKRNNHAIKVKLAGCLLTFLVAAFILSNNNSSLLSTKVWLSAQLKEDFPFAKMTDWYETTLGGTPFSISPQGSVPATSKDEYILPVTGQVSETFQKNGTGISISPSNKSTVSAFDSGVVIFSGKKKSTNRTVIIQHADGKNTTYGHLDKVDVHAYERVSANQRIGTFTPDDHSEAVYFSIEKNQQYIDPAQVISVDNLP